MTSYANADNHSTGAEVIAADYVVSRGTVALVSPIVIPSLTVGTAGTPAGYTPTPLTVFETGSTLLTLTTNPPLVPTLTVTFCRVDRCVTITIPAIVVPSCAVLGPISGGVMPARLRPLTGTQENLCRTLIVRGAPPAIRAVGRATIDAAGALIIRVADFADPDFHAADAVDISPFSFTYLAA